jgi:hypothetical protein
MSLEESQSDERQYDGRYKWGQNSHLSHNDQYITLGNIFRSRKRGMKCSRTKRDIYEWICRHDQDQDFRSPSNMMIDKTPPRVIIHRCVNLAIAPFEEEAFEDVEAYDEVIHKDNADNEGAEGS